MVGEIRVWEGGPNPIDPPSDTGSTVPTFNSQKTRSLSQKHTDIMGSGIKESEMGDAAAKKALHFLIKASVNKMLYSDFIPH